METKDLVKNASLEELKAALAEKEKEEKKRKEIEKELYEAERDELIASLVQRAITLNRQMSDFKQYALEQLEAHKQKAMKYGNIRAHSKGGFSIRHSETQQLVSLDRNAVPEYDERAAMAEDLIKEFLQDKVKKKDIQTYNTIAALLERNKKGDYTPGRVASLLKIKNNYDDERWVKAMELFEESFRIREISYSVSFYTKDQLGKDKIIPLTFASIPVYFKEEKEKS
jgi:hypothetical protein